jgi:hypothetical protein
VSPSPDCRQCVALATKVNVGTLGDFSTYSRSGPVEGARWVEAAACVNLGTMQVCIEQG